jgi:hypothetical protein
MLKERQQAEQVSNERKLVKEPPYPLQTIIALQRLLADGIPAEAANNMPGISQASADPLPLPVSSAAERVETNTRDWVSSIVKCLLPFMEATQQDL